MVDPESITCKFTCSLKIVKLNHLYYRVSRKEKVGTAQLSKKYFFFTFLDHFGIGMNAIEHMPSHMEQQIHTIRVHTIYYYHEHGQRWYTAVKRWDTLLGDVSESGGSTWLLLRADGRRACYYSFGSWRRKPGLTRCLRIWNSIAVIIRTFLVDEKSIFKLL